MITLIYAFFVTCGVIVVVCVIVVSTINTRQHNRLQSHGKDASEIFYTKVAGVTKRTPNGESRQRIIKDKLMHGNRVELIPEPTNKHDPDAIKVVTEYGHHIGYIPADVASGMVRDMNSGKKFTAIISEITGGTGYKRNVGVNLKVAVYLPPKART